LNKQQDMYLGQSTTNTKFEFDLQCRIISTVLKI